MTRKVLLAALLLVLAASANAATRYWDGDTSDDWNTAANWSAAKPTSADIIEIGGSTYNPTYWPVFTAGDTPAGTSGQLRLGSTKNATFTMGSGQFDQTGLVQVGYGNGTTSSFIMNGGTFNSANEFRLAPVAGSSGNLQVNGGTLNVNSNLKVGYASGAAQCSVLISGSGSVVSASGAVQLADYSTTGFNVFSMSGGSLSAGTYLRFGYYGSETYADATISGGLLTTPDLRLNRFWIDFSGGEIRATGTMALLDEGTSYMDFTGGNLYVKGDYRGSVATWITNGRMKTTSAGLIVRADYDSGTDYTHIYAGVPEPASVLALLSGVLGMLGITCRKRG